MRKLAFSPDYKEKISNVRQWLDLRFGKDIRAKAMQNIKAKLASLKMFPEQGVSVQAMFGIESSYHLVFVAHNYIFYEFDDERVYVVNIYNEREDFMYQLFGIKTTSSDTESYWDE
ncbi:Plasmid stabilization system protein ParE [Butyrivibrio sp. INlla18]|uniref:type II toxin-antitoxin system RelE/ParE family toxin n=1 Tax=Butyrivibrio sp. INlla18 TaxID=1520806 RepID=UPI000891F302|nr:type II toxin-antitoxin system RelE/ParE family toxin [Butyrivibrio sp. INlla18]SDA79229.1 Plasmid stabilization system protein ParE [Butyrivibrio sp. INlla18]